jgi:predicted nucleic acid-binding protein
MSYWDTSCLIKLYTPEPDSMLFRSHLAGGNACVTCDITPLEVWATLRRKESEGILSAGEAETVFRALEVDISSGDIRLISCDSVVRQEFHFLVEQCHARIPPIYIRTNDALHLAAARCYGASEIVATDKRVRDASIFAGFKVFPPP